MKAMTTTICAAMICAAPAFADFQKVESRADFVALVSGKTLTRPRVKLQVSPNGQISGKGAAWPVSGKWQWKDGYLCSILKFLA